MHLYSKLSKNKHMYHEQQKIGRNTVDGRNPAPVDCYGSLSQYSQGFTHPNGGCLDFFHQTYEDSPWKRTHERHEFFPFPTCRLRPLKSRKQVEISMRPGALPVSKLSLLGDM